MRLMRRSPSWDEEAAHAAHSTASNRPPKTAREKAMKDHTNAFSSYQDHSRMNVRRHNTSRTDTFHTPSKLEKDFPTRVDNKKMGLVGDMPFNDLLWICEQSFRKEASDLGKEVMALARAELTNVTEVLLRDVRQPVEALTEQIVGKICKILQEVEAPAKVDWLPVLDEISALRDQLHFLRQDLLEEMARLKGETQGLHKHQEQASSSLCASMQQVRDEVKDLQLEVTRRSERQVTHVLNLQQSIASETAQVSHALQDLQQEVHLGRAALNASFEAQLAKHLRERPVNVDFGQVCSQLGHNRDETDKGLKGISNDVFELRSEFRREFSQKFEGVLRAMDKQRAVTVKLEEEIAQATHQDGFARHAVRHGHRDHGVQTAPPLTTDRSAQTDGRAIVPKKLEHRGEHGRSTDQVDREREEAERLKQKERMDKVFQQGETLKRKARQALMKPQYSVAACYRESGWAQAVARHWLFEYLTFFVIFANSIWIAVDIDNNEAAILVNAPPIFQVADNIFCAYYTSELLVRFLAFASKWDCLRDGWFVFDSILAVMGIIETWILSIIVLAVGGSNSLALGGSDILRMVRMTKMVRLSRMARLLRAIPELLVLLKAIGMAVRSMMIFFLMWLVVIYVFAVVFRQLTEGQEVGRTYFAGVPAAMNTLVVQGILPENTTIMTSLLDESLIYWPLMVSFILLTSITLMYLLIGVLTEVIHIVAKNEKEGAVVTAVASRMRATMRSLGRCEEVPLSKMEFQELLVHPEVVSLCTDVGVNVIALVDMSEVIYESCDKEGRGMTFENLVEVILNMRGANPATVKDVKEQLRVIKGMVTEATTGMMLKISRELRGVNQQVQDLRKTFGDDGESGPDAKVVVVRGQVTHTFADADGSPRAAPL